MSRSWLFPKKGSSSKPSTPYSVQLYVTKALWICIPLVALVAVLTAYYLYLDGLYLVDEILEGDGPKEPQLVEKFTIRMHAPLHLQDLKDFVKEYTICKAVHEIQIIWTQPEDNIPNEGSFTYLHTHSKVTVLNRYGKHIHDALYGSQSADEVGTSSSTVSSLGPLEIGTDSVLLLDADVSVSCKELMFMQSVWRSSKDALVGLFPRLHWDSLSSSDSIGLEKLAKYSPFTTTQAIQAPDGTATAEAGTTYTNTNTNTNTDSKKQRYNLLGWTGVVMHGAYSLMLPAGVMMKKEYLESLGSSDTMRTFLATSPQCTDLAVPLWAAAQDSASPPIFADVFYSIKRAVQLAPYYTTQMPRGSSSHRNRALFSAGAYNTGVEAANKDRDSSAVVKLEGNSTDISADTIGYSDRNHNDDGDDEGGSDGEGEGEGDGDGGIVKEIHRTLGAGAQKRRSRSRTNKRASRGGKHSSDASPRPQTGSVSVDGVTGEAFYLPGLGGYYSGKKRISFEMQSQCLTDLMAVLRLESIPVASFKASVAKNHWFW